MPSCFALTSDLGRRIRISYRERHEEAFYRPCPSRVFRVDQKWHLLPQYRNRRRLPERCRALLGVLSRGQRWIKQGQDS